MTPSQVHKSAVLSINVFFYTNYNNYYKVSVVFSMSRQWQMLLLAWHEHDESLTWWWQDNRCSANRNLLFLGQASFSGSQRCLQTVNFLLPPPLPPCTGGQYIRCGLYYFYHTRLTDFQEKNRGSMNRLEDCGLTSLLIVEMMPNSADCVISGCYINPFKG